jgi:hypothetical protein
METISKAKTNKEIPLSQAAGIMASKNASPEERRHAAAILGRAGGKHRITGCKKIDEVAATSTIKEEGLSN